ncbi:MAG: DUF1848 domain-containing protein [Eubacteriales bacterium]
MIVSASRRTDIPATYSGWFFERLRQGYALVPNPFNSVQVRRVSLAPEDVDCIVFWTKNASPMLEKLDALKEHRYYFQFTITCYENDVEKGLPVKEDILQTFIKLSDRIGPERVLWRYDPVFLSPKYSLETHLKYFEKIARMLQGYTEKCTISFMDQYKSVEKRMQPLTPEPWTHEKMREAAKGFSEIAFSYGFGMDTCAEEIDLSDLDIRHAHCIDAERIERLFGIQVDGGKDKYQRPACGCAASVDIGVYNTCPGGCLYCYANYNTVLAVQNYTKHDTNAPVLCGKE